MDFLNHYKKAEINLYLISTHQDFQYSYVWILGKYEVLILNCKVANPCKVLEVKIKVDSEVADPREIAKENNETRDRCEVPIER